MKQHKKALPTLEELLDKKSVLYLNSEQKYQTVIHLSGSVECGYVHIIYDDWWTANGCHEETVIRIDKENHLSILKDLIKNITSLLKFPAQRTICAMPSVFDSREKKKKSLERMTREELIQYIARGQNYLNYESDEGNYFNVNLIDEHIQFMERPQIIYFSNNETSSISLMSTRYRISPLYSLLKEDFKLKNELLIEYIITNNIELIKSELKRLKVDFLYSIEITLKNVTPNTTSVEINFVGVYDVQKYYKQKAGESNSAQLNGF